MPSKEELISYCHKVYKEGLVAASDGNLSLRFSDNILLITRSGVSKGDISSEDILACSLDGKKIMGKGNVSTEIKLHLQIYKSRKDVNAVIHFHPVYASAFAVSDYSLDIPVFPEVILTLGRIPLCSYAAPSTNSLAESIIPHIDYANVFLLQNHGAVTVGKSLKEAFYRAEKLEHYAKTLHKAYSLGKIKTLTQNQLDELYNLAEYNYGIKLNLKNKFTL